MGRDMYGCEQLKRERDRKRERERGREGQHGMGQNSSSWSAE